MALYTVDIKEFAEEINSYFVEANCIHEAMAVADHIAEIDSDDYTILSITEIGGYVWSLSDLEPDENI